MRTYRRHIKYFFPLILLISITEFSFSQCNNVAQYGGTTAPTGGGSNTISTCNYAGEYAPVTGVAVATNYQITSSIATDFITIRQGTPGGPVIAFGVQPLNWTSTVAGTYYVHFNTSAACGSQNSCRNTVITHIVPSVPMVYTSSTCTQTNTSNVETCASDAEIIGIQVVTTGNLTPLDITQFRLRTAGSSAPIADISNIDVYYTGTSSTFGTTTFFGNAAAAGTGTNIFVNGTQTLAEGTNYFWVVYDINGGATVSNNVDALCNRITVDASNYTPTVTTPAGARTIVACTPTPGSVGAANLTAWFKATDVANGNVTSWTTAYPTGGGAISLTDAVAPYSQCTNTPTTSIFNYNSVVDFSGNDGANQKQLMNTSALNLLTNQNSTSTGTFFVVHAAPTVGNNDGVVTFKNGQHGIQMRGWGRLALGANNSSNGTRNFAAFPATQPMIISYKGNKSSSTSMTAYKNDNVFTTATGSSAAMSNGLTFGAKHNSPTTYNEYFTGYLSEVIFFDEDLSLSQINKVHTYVGIKYSITLDNTGGGTQGDYIATDGTTIWDASANTGYHNNVIGIGRDDNEVLLQKQSHTFDDTTRIYVSTLAATNIANGGTFSSDISYVLVGDNQGVMRNSPGANAEVPIACGLNSRLEREWKVTKTNFTDNFNFDAKLNASASPALVTVSDLRLLVDDDGDFSNGGTTCYFNGDGTGIVISYSNPVITVSNISGTHISNNSLRYITIGSINGATPLPVELISFEAKCIDAVSKLDWTTASEINNDYFTIERGTDAESFYPIATIAGNGNSSSLISYSWIDDNPLGGTTFYRLKQTDFDGEIEYLGVRSVTCEQSELINVYPNPFKDHLIVQLPVNSNKPYSIIIKDYLGRVLIQETLSNSNGQNQLNLNHLKSKGIYFISITNDLNKEIYHQKIIKM